MISNLLSSHVSLAGLVESQELVPLILVSGTTFTQLSLLVAVECGPSQAHLVTSKSAMMKCEKYNSICTFQHDADGGMNIRYR